MCSRSLTFSSPHKHPMNSLSGPGEASTAPRPESLSKRLSRALSVGRYLLIGPIHPRPQVSDALSAPPAISYKTPTPLRYGADSHGLSPSKWQRLTPDASQDGKSLSGKGTYVNLSAFETMSKIECGVIHPALCLTIGSSERDAEIAKVADEEAAKERSRQEMMAARHNQQMASLNNATVQTLTVATGLSNPIQGSGDGDSKPATVQGYQPSSWGITGHPAVTCRCPVGYCTHLYSPGEGAW